MKGRVHVNTYEAGIQRLTCKVAAMINPWSSTSEGKEIAEFSERLKDLADDLGGDSLACNDIEAEHDKGLLPLLGQDGYSTPEPDFSCSYQATLNLMRALANSAEQAAKNLPDSRRRFALTFAAMGLLHLKAWHGHKAVVIYFLSDDVAELQAIYTAAVGLAAAGKVVSDERICGALGDEFKQFDPHYYPPGIWEVISGE